MTRLPGWPERLAAVVEAARRRPCRWGQHDCALFALDCLDAQSGGALAARFRGTYRGPLEASIVFGREGLHAFAGRVAAEAGLSPADPLRAGRGAVLAHQDAERRPALAVVIDWRAAVPGAAGLVFFRRSALAPSAAWECR